MRKHYFYDRLNKEIIMDLNGRPGKTGKRKVVGKSGECR